MRIAGFFNIAEISSLDGLKKEYYRLAKKHHPDAGGSNEDMKAVNKEYEELFTRLLKGENLSAQEKDIEAQISAAYKEIINQVIGFPGLIIEVIGLWIWVSGSTYPVREQLKKAGFLFASQKKMWFWRPPEFKSNKYGSKLINPVYEQPRAIHGIPSFAKTLKRLQLLLSIKSESGISGIGGNTIGEIRLG